MNQAKPMSKEALRAMLAHETERYEKIYGGEVTRYASPQNVKPILNKKPGKKPVNLRQEEWQKFLSEVQAGTYRPDTQFQTRVPSKKAIRLEELV